MFVQNFSYEATKRKEKIQRWIAWKLPHSIVMWAFIRVTLHGTNNKWGRQIVPELTALDALKRWDESNIGPVLPYTSKHELAVPKTDQYSHTNSKGVTYYLNVKDVTLRGGKKVAIRYFTKDSGRAEATTLPEGFTVAENPRNGFLTIRTPAMIKSEQSKEED